MQKISLIGRLVRDAAVRENGQTGNRFASFTVAVNTKSRGADKTSYYDVLWSSYSEKMVPYLTKGSAVCVGGDLDAGQETGRDGKQYLRLNVFADYVQFTGITSGTSGTSQTTVTEVVAPAPSTVTPSAMPAPEPAVTANPAYGKAGASADAEDDLPF